MKNLNLSNKPLFDLLLVKTRSKVVHKNVSQGLKKIPFVTFNDSVVICTYMKYLRIHNVSIHITFFHQNRVRLKNFFYSRKDGKTEFFCEMYRRTYVLNDIGTTNMLFF